MSALGLAITLIFYAALVTFIIGFLYRILSWWRVPVPLKISLTPAPASYGGATFRVATEVLIFNSLFKADKQLWAGSWFFHVSFALIVLRHLRYFLEPVPGFVLNVQTLGIYAGFVLVGMLFYLFMRRVLIDRNYYITTFADYFVIWLLISIGVTGLYMKYISPVPVLDVKAFVVSALMLRPVAAPTNLIFVLHILLVSILLAYFPFSKLMHAGGIFFSPTRNQRDNTRDAKFKFIRHANPWNEAVKDPTIYPDGVPYKED